MVGWKTSSTKAAPRALWLAHSVLHAFQANSRKMGPRMTEARGPACSRSRGTAYLATHISQARDKVSKEYSLPPVSTMLAQMTPSPESVMCMRSNAKRVVLAKSNRRMKGHDCNLWAADSGIRANLAATRGTRTIESRAMEASAHARGRN